MIKLSVAIIWGIVAGVAWGLGFEGGVIGVMVYFIVLNLGKEYTIKRR